MRAFHICCQTSVSFKTGMTQHSLLFTFPWCPASKPIGTEKNPLTNAAMSKHVTGRNPGCDESWGACTFLNKRTDTHTHKAGADKCKLRAGLPPPGQWYELLPILHSGPWNPHLSAQTCTHIHVIGPDLVRYWLVHHGEWLKWAQVLAYCGTNCAWQINKTPGGLDVNAGN